MKRQVLVYSSRGFHRLDLLGPYIQTVCRYSRLVDIIDGASTRSMCYTKAYSHYIEGTGSVYQVCFRLFFHGGCEGRTFSMPVVKVIRTFSFRVCRYFQATSIERAALYEAHYTVTDAEVRLIFTSLQTMI
jgi:hypothetical protein